MVSVTLRKLLSKKDKRTVIYQLAEALEINLIIQDAEGNRLLGEPPQELGGKYEVKLAGETLGWVIGSEKGAAIANLLSYLANQELEKKTLAGEVLDKYRETTLLYDISSQLTACLDLKEVANLVMAEAHRLIQASTGLILLFNECKHTLERRASFGKSSEIEALLKTSHSLINHVIETGTGEIINDLQTVENILSNSLSLNALICVPLKTKDKVIGAMVMGHAEAGNYTAQDLKLLTMLAFQAASAIENARFHEKQLLESYREAILFRLSSQIRESLNLEEILETAVTEIRNFLEIDRCVFIWYRPAKTINHFMRECSPLGYSQQPKFKAAGWEVVSEARNLDLPSLRSYYTAKAVGSWTERFLEMNLVQIDDIHQTHDPHLQKFFKEQGFCSVLAVPLQTRSGEIGLIGCCHSTQIKPWSESEVELIKSVANQLEIAINQAALYEQSCQSAAVAQAKAQQLQQALKELQQTQSQLIQSEKMSSLGMLVAGVAHEINNPVNFISGNLLHATSYATDLLKLLQLYQQEYPLLTPTLREEIEAMDLDFLREDLPNLLASMNVGAERIRQIVLNLKNFSRLDEAEKKPVDIHQGIDSTLLILHHRLKPKGKGSEIQVIKEYGTLPPIECYAGQLNQVFMNLIANAIDAVEVEQKNPQILIRTQIIKPKIFNESFRCSPSVRSEFYVRITIADNGIGMTEEVKNRLFDPFFTTKPVGKGTGLGLSISYQIVVEKHGGNFQCFSSPGQGAEFIIDLPIVLESSQSHSYLSEAKQKISSVAG
jgi:two-component system NtrC family sensor kinase